MDGRRKTHISFQLFHYTALFLAWALLIILKDFAFAQQTKPDLSHLPRDKRQAIEDVCRQRKIVLGLAAYYQCLRDKLRQLEPEPTRPDRPDLSHLPHDERQAIEEVCRKRKLAHGPAAYNKCLIDKLGELEWGPGRPDLSHLPHDDRQAIEDVCHPKKLVLGPAAYYQCLIDKLGELEWAPDRPDLSRLPDDERQAIEDVCLPKKLAHGPAAYNKCLGDQLAALRKPIREIPIVETPPKRVAPPPHVPSPRVSPEDIRKAQILLSKLGYDPGPIDGILGERTRSAIKEFQRRFRLPVTGEVDRILLLDLIMAFIVLKSPQKPPVQITRPKPEAIDTIPGTNEILAKMPSLVAQNPLDAAELYKKVQSSVFVVVASPTLKDLHRGTQLSQGSAVAVSPSQLLTNCHILENCPYVLVVQDEKMTRATLVGRNEKWDRCVLAVKKSRLDPVKGIRRFDDLKVGEKVYSVGAPIGLERTLGEGIISGLRKLETCKLIQTSAQISSGSSGGGLFDARGNLIGITTFLLREAQNINFAIAAEQYWE